MTSKRTKTMKTSKFAKSATKAQMADAIKSEATKGGERFYVPLKNLIPDPKNVRRYESDAELGSLKALIVTHDVLQNLVVRPAPKGKFFVTTGSRRLRALKELQKEGQSSTRTILG